jgi:N-acetyltransferase 10
LVGMGLQFKSIDSLEKDLDLPSNQILALFNKVIKKLIQLIDDINVKELGMKYKTNEDNAVDVLDKMKPLKETLAQELNEAAKDVLRNSNLKLKNIEQYAVKGSEKDWTNALNLNQTSTASSYVTIKR